MQFGLYHLIAESGVQSLRILDTKSNLSC